MHRDTDGNVVLDRYREFTGMEIIANKYGIGSRDFRRRVFDGLCEPATWGPEAMKSMTRRGVAPESEYKLRKNGEGPSTRHPFEPDDSPFVFETRRHPEFTVMPQDIQPMIEASEAIIAEGGLLGVMFRLYGEKRAARRILAALSEQSASQPAQHLDTSLDA